MNGISESAIDRHIERAISYYGRSDTGLKYTCIACSPVVGSYDGTTQAIAHEIQRSVSTVENYAHAHWLYKGLRRSSNGSKKLVRTLWRELPASHWWQAWNIFENGYDALYYLTLAYQHKFSGRAMMGEYRKDIEAGNAPLIFRRAMSTIYGLAGELLKHSQSLTEGQRIALLSVQDEFDVNGDRQAQGTDGKIMVKR